ncbi:Thioredoxin-like 1-1 protein [Thalictrum thalictroides]|uniref:Thioredoxin-like 1-1 protein n=1 Tax=Thalictrum thalictroides TaxID=46969 RepID=A0A7J6VE51_THATH|nr:Thioredoxin-like 1-1 protein [Thalictrum thalictroides]
MAVSFKTGFCLSGSIENELNKKMNLGVYSSVSSLQLNDSKGFDFPVLKNEFKGRQIVVSDQISHGDWNLKASANISVKAQGSHCVSKALRWWDKTLQPNMVEIKSAPELVDTLVNAGDKLVIIDFYSPGCGGCKALHPKICQFAESNPNALFLKVNYEELKPMCYSLNIHVLPFFRFYRGAEGRVCSFSCTNATVKKFRDALAKHGNERCSLGPAKGLEESELLKLASNGEITLDFPSRSVIEERKTMEDLVLAGTPLSNSPIILPNKIGVVEENAAVLV